MSEVEAKVWRRCLAIVAEKILHYVPYNGDWLPDQTIAAPTLSSGTISTTCEDGVALGTFASYVVQSKTAGPHECPPLASPGLPSPPLSCPPQASLPFPPLVYPYTLAAYSSMAWPLVPYACVLLMYRCTRTHSSHHPP